jgi:exonuclease SbcC
MIPLRLQLRNFMCYHEPAPLDFTGVHLACLTGDNGHGKSALLDAMTWALWGKARARSDDELVAAGRTETEVQLEFALSDARYRVIRRRELGRPGKSALELHVWHDGQFRSLTGSTLRETQARIGEILRTDYATFINSSLLLQGRADEFTVKAPTERKRILADILGLSAYDGYEARAKALARAREQGEREIQGRIQEIERELTHRPDYERELDAALGGLADLSNQARSSEAALLALRDRLKALEAQQAQVAEIGKRMRGAEKHVGDLNHQIQVLEGRIASNEGVLLRRTEIEAGHAQWLHAGEEEARHAAKLPQLLVLNENRAMLEKNIAEAKQQVELQARAIDARIVELRKASEQSPQWEVDRAQASAALSALIAEQEALQANRNRLADLSRQNAELDTLNRQTRIELSTLKDRLRLLDQPTAVCPLCGQNLAEADRLRMVARLKAESSEKSGLQRSNQLRLKQLKAEIESLDADAARMERDLRRLPALQGRHAALGENLAQAAEAAMRLEQEQRDLRPLRQALENGAFAVDERAELARLQSAIVALGYDRAAHDLAREAKVRLARFEEDWAQLQRANEALTELRANREPLLAARLQWSQALDQDQRRHDELTAGLAGLSLLERDVQARQAEADALRGREGRERQAVGAAQQKLDYCSYLTNERKERAIRLQELAEERGLYEELQLAFGKKGLQALMIESAIPEIEVEANQLLGRMTEGRMSLRFDTQRDTKSGSTVETLDIRISDEAGSRSYEMYSGGEAFRVNFAIRIALSKLLARRSGAQLQTLVIDEGFGTQDSEGRQRLVEAIRSIQDDFGLIIAITHIDELKDAFPVRIDVVKTPSGSQLSIG